MPHMMFAPGWGSWLPVILPLFMLLIFWSLAWQALGMWHAARRGEWIWFLVFLLVHTLGILEIIYLFAFLGLSWRELLRKGEHDRS